MINLPASISTTSPLRTPGAPTGKTGGPAPEAEAAAPAGLTPNAPNAPKAPKAPNGFAKAMKQAVSQRHNKAAVQIPQRPQNPPSSTAKGAALDAASRLPAQKRTAHNGAGAALDAAAEPSARSASDHSTLHATDSSAAAASVAAGSSATAALAPANALLSSATAANPVVPNSAPNVDPATALSSTLTSANAPPSGTNNTGLPATTTRAGLARPAPADEVVSRWQAASESAALTRKTPTSDKDPHGRFDLVPTQPHLHTRSSPAEVGSSSPLIAAQLRQDRLAGKEPVDTSSSTLATDDAASAPTQAQLRADLANSPTSPPHAEPASPEAGDARHLPGTRPEAGSSDLVQGSASSSARNNTAEVYPGGKPSAGTESTAVRHAPIRHTADRTSEATARRVAAGIAEPAARADADTRALERLSAPASTAAVAAALPAPSWGHEAEAQLAQATAAAARNTATVADSASGPVASSFSASIEAPVGSAAFAAEAGYRLALMVRDGVQRAELQLHPAEMGPVTVQIVVDGLDAQVHLSAQQSDTRQALEASLPQLASNLRESGLTLTGGGVMDQPSSQPNGQQGGQQGGQAEGSTGTGSGERGSGRNGGGDGRASDGERHTLAGHNLARRATRGIVDLLA